MTIRTYAATPATLTATPLRTVTLAGPIAGSPIVEEVRVVGLRAILQNQTPVVQMSGQFATTYMFDDSDPPSWQDYVSSYYYTSFSPQQKPTIVFYPVRDLDMEIGL